MPLSLTDRLERAVLSIAPQWARARQLARLSFELTAQRSARFEAAGLGRRAEGWRRAGQDGPGNAGPELATLRARSRDMRRNNPYARRAIDSIVANTVGTGIKARIRRADGSTHQELQRAWDSWANSTQCDADGRCTFAGIQRLALTCAVESGDSFVRLRQRPVEAGQVPIQLQVLEADYCDVGPSLGRTTATQRVVQGIEFGDRGQRVAYWFYAEHPSEAVSPKQVRVAAEEVAHLYRMDRPGQRRGVPWLAPVMTRLFDLDQYEDAQLERQRVASLFAAFVNDETGMLDPAQAAAAQSWEMPTDLQPGGLLELPPGRKVEFSAPPEASGYSDYVRAILHGIGAGIGVPYAQLTGDLSRANFASSRLGRLEFQRSIRDWHEGIVFPFCQQVFEWWLDAMAYSLGIDTSGVTAVWFPPRPELVDPQRETTAMKERIRSGLSSWQAVVRELGHDPEQILDEIAEDNAGFDAKGLVLDSDPRKQAGGGYMQQPAVLEAAE